MPEPLSPPLSEHLAHAASDQEFDEAYRAALGAFDELNARTLGETGARLDCRAGCSLCCSLRVHVYAHEIFLLARHVRAHFSEAELAGLRERLAAHSETVLPLTPFEHATRNVPCPLLRDGQCSVYEARPLACRRHHSLSLAACEYTFTHPADLDFPAAHEPALIRALTEAMSRDAATYRQLGYDVTLYELGTALEEALNDPESWTSWRERLEAFIRASVTPVSGEEGRG